MPSLPARLILCLTWLWFGLSAACALAAPVEQVVTPSALPRYTPIETGFTPYLPTPIAPLPSTPSPSPSPPLPQPTATPLACWSQGGSMEEGSLSSPLLRLPLEFKVYLPPCYAQQVERRYPVLYLIHGQNYDQEQWDRLGADEAAGRLIAAGEVPPFILVLPRDRSWSQPDEDLFGQVLSEAFIPYIDQTYRTLPERRFRAIGGLSRGAGWAVHLGLSRWELFGAIGAHSLPVFWSDTAHIRQWLEAIPEGQLPRIYLDIGEKDRPAILRSAMWFEALLSEEGIPHEWHLFPGYHDEAYWQAHVEGYLRWYAATWK